MTSLQKYVRLLTQMLLIVSRNRDGNLLQKYLTAFNYRRIIIRFESISDSIRAPLSSSQQIHEVTHNEI